MSIPTIGVVVFPGSNCDRDAEAAWTELGFGNVKMLWHQDTDLTGIDAIIVPGGFSYGDALRAGAVASAEDLLAEAATHVARYKLPKAFVFRDAILRSPAGKADYRWAKEQAALDA